MVRPAGERKERNCGISFAAVSGVRYCHLTTVYAVAVAKEDYDVAVKQVAESIEYHAGIGAKAVTVSAEGSRQRQIHSTPTAAAIGGKISAHRIADDLIRTSGKNFRVLGINGDKG